MTFGCRHLLSFSIFGLLFLILVARDGMVQKKEEEEEEGEEKKISDSNILKLMPFA